MVRSQTAPSLAFQGDSGQMIPNKVIQQEVVPTTTVSATTNEPLTTLPSVGIHQALVQAKKEMAPVRKTAKNLGFQGAKYATLQDTIGAIEDALLNNDIVLTQTFRVGDNNERVLVTTLTHAPSRESISSEMVVFAPYFADSRKKTGEEDGRETRDPQAIGSAITYYRRYALQAICGVAPEDDDGNAASRTGATAATVAAVKLGPNGEALRAAMRAQGADTVSKAKEMLSGLGYTGAVGDLTEAQAGELLTKVKNISTASATK